MKWIMKVYFTSGYIYSKETIETPKVLEQKRDELLKDGYRRSSGNVIYYYPAHSITEVKIHSIP